MIAGGDAVNDGCSMRLDDFGQAMAIVRVEHTWKAFASDSDGKRRRVEGLVIPAELSGHEVVQYVADICHEMASPQRADVNRLSD